MAIIVAVIAFAVLLIFTGVIDIGGGSGGGDANVKVDAPAVDAPPAPAAPTPALQHPPAAADCIK